MNTINKEDEMPEKTLKLVLQEILDEQKNTNEINIKLINAVSILSKKVDEMDNKMGNPSTITTTVDTKPIEAILKKSMAEILYLINASPKTTTKKFQISLFPEQHAKTLYSRLFLCFLAAFAFFLIYLWTDHWLSYHKY
jgi:hypothetical protein